MSEMTIFCGCTESSCPLSMHVEWFRDHIVVTVWDGLGSADKRTFVYQEFVDLLAELSSYPLNDKTDIYYYDLAIPMRGANNTTIFHLYDANRDTIVARTKEMANVYGHEIRAD